MPAAGLRSRPPLSKQTPLPTRVSFGRSSSPQTRSISRGAMAARAADGMDRRIVLRQQIVARDGRDPRPVAAAELADGGFEPLRPHIVRRRVDEVAHQRVRLDGRQGGVPVRLRGPDEAGMAAPAAAGIGVERIAAEPPGGGGPRRPGGIEVVLDAESAAAKQARQAAAGPHVCGPVRAGEHARRPAVRIRQHQRAAGLRLEAVGRRPIARGGRGALEPARQALLVQDEDGHGIGRIGQENSAHGSVASLSAVGPRVWNS